MEKVAIISGVYGDLNSLRSVLYDIERRGIEIVYCLGNSIKKDSTDNSECLSLIKEKCNVSLMGDKEEGIGVIEKAEEYSLSDIDYLFSLPFSHQFFMSGRLVRLFNDNPYNSFNKRACDTKADLFKPSIRTGQSIADIIICGNNAGSLEEMIDSKILIGVQNVSERGMFANYMIIEGELDSYEFAPISFQHVKVPTKGLCNSNCKKTNKCIRLLYANQKES